MSISSELTPKSALVVCGKFHYFNYVSELEEAGILDQFLYSHRLSSRNHFKKQIRFTNLFLKEYLFQTHARLLGDKCGNYLNPLYHWQWDFSVSHILKKTDILHFLMHGNCIRTLKKAKNLNIKIIGEAVNSHPLDYQFTLDEQHADLGLSGVPYKPRFIEKIIDEIPLTDHILVPSNFVKDSYIANGVEPGKIHKIPYGANLNQFVPGIKNSNKFRVICVAQVALRKGHQYLLRAWKKLNLPNAELHCYGFIDDKVLSALKKIDASNVFFHGSIPKSNLIHEIQNSSVFILPTVEEGFAVSVLEGLACGIPVITTVNSGAEGVITHEKDGMLIRPRSVDDIQDAILKLYENEELRLLMGKNGRILVEGQFNWGNYVKRLIEFYKIVKQTD
jgi:glycosyltransferase involved in cell wall biosynthesis